MSTKMDLRQSVLRSAQAMLGSSANATADSLFPLINDQLAKLFEDRNSLLSGGGTITVNSTATSVSFTASLFLHVNSLVAGGSPKVIDLTSTTRAFTSNGNMLYAVIDRSAGTATITADAATLPTVVAANQEVFLIAKRIGTSIHFRNGFVMAASQVNQLGRVGLVFDSELIIADSSDATKRILFDASGTTSTSTTLTSSQTSSVVLTLPNITDTLVSRTNTESLSNKSISFSSSNDSTTTGGNATLVAFTTGIVRLTDGSLTSVSGIPAGTSGQILIIENKTGNQISINDEEATATAVNRILTGAAANVTMSNNASYEFVYDNTSHRWQLIGNFASSGGGSSYNLYVTQTTVIAYTTGVERGIPSWNSPLQNNGTGGTFNTSNGVWTCDSSGLYTFIFRAGCVSNSGGAIYPRLLHSSGVYIGAGYGATGDEAGNSANAIFYVNAGETVTLRVKTLGTQNSETSSTAPTYFCAARLN